MSTNSMKAKAGWTLGGVAAALAVGASMGFSLGGSNTGDAQALADELLREAEALP